MTTVKEQQRNNTAKKRYFKLGTKISQELFITEQKNCKKVLQQEKRKFTNNILQNAEDDCSQGILKNFFKTIKHFKQFNLVCSH